MSMNINECRKKLIDDKKALAGLRFEKNLTKDVEKRKAAEAAIAKMEEEIKHLEKHIKHHM